jgi:hypothetical protein
VPLALTWPGVAWRDGALHPLWHVAPPEGDGRVLLYRCAAPALRGQARACIGRFAAIAEARLAAMLLDAAMPAGAAPPDPAAPWRLGTPLGALTLRAEPRATRLVLEAEASPCHELARMFHAVPACPHAHVLRRIALLRCGRADASPLEPLGVREVEAAL